MLRYRWEIAWLYSVKLGIPVFDGCRIIETSEIFDVVAIQRGFIIRKAVFVGVLKVAANDSERSSINNSMIDDNLDDHATGIRVDYGCLVGKLRLLLAVKVPIPDALQLVIQLSVSACVPGKAGVDISKNDLVENAAFADAIYDNGTQCLVAIDDAIPGVCNFIDIDRLLPFDLETDKRPVRIRILDLAEKHPFLNGGARINIFNKFI